MRSGTAFTHLVEFVGAVDGDLTWTLTDAAGGAVSNGTISPATGAVSAVIAVPALDNTLGVGERLGARELAWSYSVASVTQTGFAQYRLEARIPFAVTAEGVRTKLGLGDIDDLRDEEIPLMRTYLTFEDRVGAVALAAVSGDLATLLVVDALEAGAALLLLPTLQVRVAAKESSGTNQYARGKIDWETLRGELLATVQLGEGVVNTALEPGNNGVSLLQLVTPDVDLFPGA